MDSVLQYGGLLKSDLVSSTYGISVFKGAKSGVTTQLKEEFAPYMIGVHFVAR